MQVVFLKKKKINLKLNKIIIFKITFLFPCLRLTLLKNQNIYFANIVYIVLYQIQKLN